jgi:hypothetical protein
MLTACGAPTRRRGICSAAVLREPSGGQKCGGSNSACLETRGADPSRRDKILKDHNKHACVGSGLERREGDEKHHHVTLKPKTSPTAPYADTGFALFL